MDEPGGIMASEIRHRMTNTVYYHLAYEISKNKLAEVESRLEVCQRQRTGRLGGRGSKGTNFQLSDE